jgi:hypothetical protein
MAGRFAFVSGEVIQALKQASGSAGKRGKRS